MSLSTDLLSKIIGEYTDVDIPINKAIEIWLLDLGLDPDDSWELGMDLADLYLKKMDGI